MEETYVPRREFRKKTTDNVSRKYPQKRSGSVRQKNEPKLRFADIILMQGVVCTLIFAVIVCIRVINTDFTIELREKLKFAISEQLTLDDAASLVNSAKEKLVSMQQSVKTTFGFQDDLTTKAIEDEANTTEDNLLKNSTENDLLTDQLKDTKNITTDTGTSELSVEQVTVPEVSQEVADTDEALIDEEILHQIEYEISETATEKKQEPLREITPPAEGI